MGAPCFGLVLCFKNHYPRSREHFLIPSASRHTHPFGGLGLMQACTTGDARDLSPVVVPLTTPARPVPSMAHVSASVLDQFPSIRTRLAAVRLPPQQPHPVRIFYPPIPALLTSMFEWGQPEIERAVERFHARYSSLFRSYRIPGQVCQDDTNRR